MDGGNFLANIKDYNRKNAVKYAEKWAYDRNPAYYDFSKIGGDCTNFISQCLYAGSGVMNHTPVFGWYYNNLSDRAPSWSSVEALYNFLVENTARGVFAEKVTAQEVMVGDIIQLITKEGQRYHSLLITGKGDDIYVAAHTFNAYMRPLSSYIYEKADFLHIKGVYV